MSDQSPAEEAPAAPDPTPTTPSPMPIGVKLWFGWAFVLLAVTGILLPRIIEFVDFSEKAPFSLLGIFMMAELAALLFGITVAMQRKRIGHRFAIGIAVLAAPMLAGLPPILLNFPADAVAGWQALFIPVGLGITLLLVVLLLRPASRAYFSED
jgi:hypothetical protein